MSTDPRHALVKRLFSEALARSEDRRAAFLTEACSDAALRAEVESLLQAHAEADTGFLSEPPRLPATIDETRLGLERGWRVLRELARGGMGVVYLAERADGAYQQQVALKLLAPGSLPDEESLLRLKLERQILARLNHPNIARLLDGGTTEHGAPYLVMEYVEGERIDRWCQAQGLGLQARVDLFLKVCTAVSYAHRNLVVHRDLKPSNILVRLDGEPKLLDFGIAKELSVDSEQTRAGGQMLTPRYASPEQIRSEPVSTLSDVYSLGVVLYELLTGRSPYGKAVEQPPALARAVCEIDPDAPSTARRNNEHADTPSLKPAGLKGDMDAIVLRCLRKTPEQRYSSVEALMEDLQAWREGRPVAARRGSGVYRLRRFARRHWVALGSAAAVLALVALFVLQLSQQLEATRLERDRSDRTLAFVTELFRVADPSEARGSSVTVREILDRGAQVLEQDRSLEPPARASMLHTLGAVYRQLGLAAAADKALESALAQAAPRDLATLRVALAGLRVDQGRFDEANTLLDQAEADPHASESQRLRSRLLHQRGDAALRQGKLDQAEAPLEAALQLRRRLHGEQSREVAEVLTALGSLQRDRGQLALAEQHYRDALSILQSLGVDAWSRAKLTNNLAIIAGDRGASDVAEQHFGEALEFMRQAVGEDHALIAVGLGNVASMRMRRGDYAGAQPMFERALAIRRSSLGETHPLTGTSLSNLAYVRFCHGDFETALGEMQQALELQSSVFGAGHLHVLNTLRNLAALQFARGELDAAVANSGQLIEQGSSTVGAEHPMLLQAQARLHFIGCLRGACDLPAFESAAQAHVDKLGVEHAEAGESLVQLATMQFLQASPSACQTTARAEQALRKHLPDAHWDRRLLAWLQERCTGASDGSAVADLAARYGEAHPLVRALQASTAAQ
jgi:serine/threonine-protein kinase